MVGEGKGQEGTRRGWVNNKMVVEGNRRNGDGEPVAWVNQWEDNGEVVCRSWVSLDINRFSSIEDGDWLRSENHKFRISL